jgi:hypothetical protein
MKKGRGSKPTKDKFLPTNAPYPFYDVLQQEFRQPRQGSFTVSYGRKTIECAWSEISTAELQKSIDELTAEIQRRALTGEAEAINTFAWKAAGLASQLQALTSIQREKVEQAAAIAPHWPVNLTQRDRDFQWAKRYVRGLKVGSKSLMTGKPESRILRHEPFARLAETLWRELLKNRHELQEWVDAGSKSARQLKTKWISFCLALPAVRTAQEVAAQDAPKWWHLGEALLLEAWEQDRQSGFGSLLPEYEGKYTEAFIKRDIFKRLKSAFLQLLKSGVNQPQ